MLFASLALTYSLAIFAVLKLPWVETHWLLPLTLFQAAIAERAFGSAADLVRATLDCGGADVMALCIGVILPYPASWLRRGLGAAGGVLLIAVLNTLRIGTLGRAAETPESFALLHVYVWPAVIILCVAGYVFWWMSMAPRRAEPAGHDDVRRPSPDLSRFLSLRFVTLSIALLAIFLGLSALYRDSVLVLTAAAMVASAAAEVLRVLGYEAVAVRNVLATDGMALLVTQDCLATPLIPVFVAAVLCHVSTWTRAVAALAAVPLLVLLLAVARLLVVAWPAGGVEASGMLVHAFHQLVVAAALVVVSALLRERHLIRGLEVASVALAAGIVTSWTVASTVAIAWREMGAAPFDPQGALAMAPGYQVALFVALWIAGFRSLGTWRWMCGLLGVGAAAVALSWVATEPWFASLAIPVVIIRGWAVLVPLLMIVVVTSATVPAALRGIARDETYRGFWHRVGDTFPDLAGASSTRFYAANEQRLFQRWLAPLEGRRIFKTDLWDEVKNTRILAWAQQRGARVFGGDIAPAIVQQAHQAYAAILPGAVADVRHLPFRDGAFDAVYSMGTIEHFDETEQALAEIARVVRPGGVVIVGVPNRHDVFLRPLVVAILHRAGLYAYGVEKSYSRRQLREMVERSGLEVVEETGILFYPGMLRLADLACHAWCPPLGRITAVLGWPFWWLDRVAPSLGRYGYLLATVARKPADVA